MKKFLCLLTTLALFVSFASCAEKPPQPSAAASGAENKGQFYFLNFKPEVASVYEEIGKVYEQETGVKLKVVTASSGTYTQTLKAEMAKENAPTLFQINGPRDYALWKDYCADLSGTQLYQHLTDQSLAVSDGAGVYGIPYVVEGYGIIYNRSVLDRYFALPQKAVSISSMDEIRGFDLLRAVVEDMTQNKDALGIEGVFASTSLKPGEDWRWHTHLANVPVYYEFLNGNIDLTSDQTKEIAFTYQQNYRQLFDLYLNHSVTEPALLGSKQVADSMAEFALGKCAMVQNGNWAWTQISEVSGNVIAPEDVRFLPLYIGVPREEQQGLCTGTENFFAINAKAPPEQQKLAEDFIWWLYSSETGKDFVRNKLGFIAPFDTFGEEDRPTDPLAKEVLRWMDRDGFTSVAWNFTLFPSQVFKDQLGSNLLQYAQGTLSWDEVAAAVVRDWKTESEG